MSHAVGRISVSKAQQQKQPVLMLKDKERLKIVIQNRKYSWFWGIKSQHTTVDSGENNIPSV